jgi:ABC-type ATPase with predicted acetyltransferase domain
VSFRAVDRNFGKQRKADAIIESTEILDFLSASRFLVFELVARKAEDFQTAVSIRLKQPLQAVILGGESSFAGHVDNEQYLAPVRL